MDQDRLAGARRDTDRQEWARALSGWRELAHGAGSIEGGRPPEAGLTDGDLVLWGTTEFLTGHPDRAVAALQSAHERQVRRAAHTQALHSAFLIATVADLQGQASLFRGWLGRAQRQHELIDHPTEAAIGRGYLAMLELRRELASGRFEEMAPLADEIAEIGHRENVADLIAMGLLTQGRLRIYQGEVAGGLALLDGAVSGVLTGGVGPLVAGVVLCTAIDGCQEVGDVDRVRQWAENLHTWCRSQPGLLAFTGAAALHHGQVLVMRGSWEEADTQLRAAIDRYLRSGQTGSAGVAARELGDLQRRRGDLEAAENAYDRAAALGCDPQPGLALLWLARGSGGAAEAAVRRSLDEAAPAARRGTLLPAAVEIVLAAQDLEGAGDLVQEADDLARLTGSASLEAAAARAHALLELARGDPAAAVPYARRAIKRWVQVQAPYEAALSRLTLASALDLMGDHKSASREREHAERACAELGAAAPALTWTRGSTPLSAREVEVLALVATGASNREVARRLTLSDRTVARHLSNIFTKLDVTSRTAAAGYAHEHGLLQPQRSDLR